MAPKGKKKKKKNRKKGGKGLILPLLDGTSAMDFVQVLIAKLKLGSDCRIDLFFFFL